MLIGFPSSPWLGQKMSLSEISSSGRSSRAGAGLSTVRTPSARAARRASRVVSTGISSWQTTTSARAIAGRACSISSSVIRSLAPVTITIALSPPGSTKIGATPEDASTVVVT